MLNECRSEVGLLSELKMFNGCLNRDHSGREISFLETQKEEKCEAKFGQNTLMTDA